jgi:hypothetical protein
MNYCLSREDFEEFIELHLNNHSLDHIDDDNLRSQLENCFNWEDQVGVLMYLFTHFMQKKINMGEQVSGDQIELLFNLPENGLFDVEIIDRNFVAYMFNYSRSKITEELPETLLIILQNYLDRTYDSLLCF